MDLCGVPEGALGDDGVGGGVWCVSRRVRCFQGPSNL